MPKKISWLLLLALVQFSTLFGQGLKSGLIANYPFAGNLLDYSPTSNHATNQGTTFVTDYCGQPTNATSYLNNASISIPYNPTVQIQPPLSFSFRVKFTSYNATETYTLWSSNTNLQNDPGYAGIVVQYYSGEFSFHIKNGLNYVSSGRRTYTVSKNITLNQWYIVSVVIPNYTTCLVNIDCQNQSVNNNGTTVTSIFYSQNHGAFGSIYYPPLSTSYYYNNQIDDFRLWNRALSPAEVNRICSSDTSYLTLETCTPHTFLGTTYPSPSVNIIPKGSCLGYYHLTLTTPASDSLLVVDSLCAGQAYSFRGQTFFAPIDTLWGTANCDSIYHLKLFEPVPDTVITNESACVGSSFTFRGQTFVAPTDTLLPRATCDSIFRLMLTTKPCDTIPVIDTLCSGESFAFYGQTYFAPEDIFIASSSGDTIFRLQLFEKLPTHTVTVALTGCPNTVLDTLGNSYQFPFVDTLLSANCDSILYLVGTISTDCDFDCKPFIPNAFTPNNDGVNDVYAIQGGIGPFSLQIYNRWGQMVFQSDDYKNTWDGTFRGAPLAEGVYSYVLECLYKNPYSSQSNPDGSVRIYTGMITIFR